MKESNSDGRRVEAGGIHAPSIIMEGWPKESAAPLSGARIDSITAAR
jgi:hypothetical protein